MSTSKLIVASVRLPVALSRNDGTWRVTDAPGGLATALRAVAADRPFTWIGFPGAPVPEADQPGVEELLADLGAVPVFLEADAFEGFYEEISNRVLWPLFHALPGARRFDRDAWRAYKEVNQQFADAIARLVEPGDTVWIHDYQLTLVPQLLRERGLDCAIGFFLHIPFPSSETYRTLPVREAILRGMLGADLIGFHTYEYVSHFRSSCLRVLGLESEPDSILLTTHNAHLGVLPIGIDPDELREMAATDEVRAEFEELRELYAGKKVIVGVDRLDYTKGLPEKLLAFAELLESQPELSEQVVMIQVAAPSRTGVAEYQSLKREMDELAGQINGKFGTLQSHPLVYINQSVPRARLTALYQLADVCLVTPVRDGMNLVSLEYICAREQPGTLILSEFAGAASCLSGARLVNPHNPSQIAEVLSDALREGTTDTAWEHLREFAMRNTSRVWATRFLERLEKVYEELRSSIRPLRIDDEPALVEGAERPLFLLDYDGSLVPHTLIPSEARPTERIRTMLAELAEWGTAYVVSGRDADFLETWLGDLPIGLVCEHGLAIKPRGGDWSERPAIDSAAIQAIVEPVFRDYTELTPGSRIERKASSIAWHYRGSDPKMGAWRAKELRGLLEELLSGQPFSVLAGSRVIEVRHAQMNKGAAATSLLRRHAGADFVFCAGDDRTDEEMFEAVLRSGHERAIVCRVGGINTVAPYMVPDSDSLLAEIDALLAIWRRADKDA